MFTEILSNIFYPQYQIASLLIPFFDQSVEGINNIAILNPVVWTNNLFMFV